MSSNENSTPLGALAGQQQLSSPEFQACWALVTRGIESHVLNADELEEVIGFLNKGWDFISDEIRFEFIGQRLRVGFLDESVFCAPQEMIEQLKALLEQCCK